MPRLVALALWSGCLVMRRSRCVSTVASTTNQTPTLCGRWAGRSAAISAMESAMAPSSPWEEAL